MKITITKRGQRNEMRCWRADGTCDVADVGRGVPYHDLAHFVAEREWQLREGFFGNIARGYSVAQLSDKHVIQSLGVESLQAEVLARAAGSALTGACTPEQFAELVNTELEHWQVPVVPVTPARVADVIARCRELVARFDALRDGESLQLEFEPAEARVIPS